MNGTSRDYCLVNAGHYAPERILLGFFCRKAKEEDEQYFHMLMAGDSAGSLVFLVKKMYDTRAQSYSIT